MVMHHIDYLIFVMKFINLCTLEVFHPFFGVFQSLLAAMCILYLSLMPCLHRLQPCEYLEVAESATKFIESKLYDVHAKRLRHSFRNGPSKAPGFLDDYAFLISGLLDLYEYGGRTDWLTWAIELQATQASAISMFEISVSY